MGLGDYTLLFDLDAIERDLQTGHEAQVQFDRPFTEPAHVLTVTGDGAVEEGPQVDYAHYLGRVNGLCAKYGARFNVRFYAHYSDVFDGSVLARLPEVRSLTANCLERATNLEAIADLAHMTELQLGVYELSDRSVLERLPLERLTAFTFEETASKAMDLAPLAAAKALRHLRLFGHKKNIEALGELSEVEELAFNPFKGVPLDFLNGMTGLKALKLVLGGTEHLNDVALANVSELALTQVRGFNDLGDLGRFPSLTRLLLQDQQHLEKVTVSKRNSALQHLWFYNCRALAALPGLHDLQSLESLHAVRTALRLDDLNLPPGMTHLSVFSGKRKDEEAETAAIEALNLKAEPHPDMPFFYK